MSGSFPHDRQLTNNGEAAGNELTISSAMPMLPSVCVKAWQGVLYRICICIVFSSPGRELRLREHRSWLLSAPRVKSHCFHLCSPHQRSFVLPQQPTAELLVAHHITPAASSDQNTKRSKKVKKGLVFPSSQSRQKTKQGFWNFCSNFDLFVFRVFPAQIKY